MQPSWTSHHCCCCWYCSGALQKDQPVGIISEDNRRMFVVYHKEERGNVRRKLFCMGTNACNQMYMGHCMGQLTGDVMR
jgi:hypothetical protein